MHLNLTGLMFFIRKIIGLDFMVGYFCLIFKIKAEINNIAYIKVNSNKKKKDCFVNTSPPENGLYTIRPVTPSHSGNSCYGIFLEQQDLPLLEKDQIREHLKTGHK